MISNPLQLGSQKLTIKHCYAILISALLHKTKNKIAIMKDDTEEVFLAEPKDMSRNHSLGNASCMLLRQFQFPHIYSDHLDKLTGTDHDRCFSQDFDHATKCLKQHTGQTGQYVIGDWIQKASDGQIIAFLTDILKVGKEATKWTGYRIMVTITLSGGPVWTLELFAKNPTSKTAVYTGEEAPNILPGLRYGS